MGKQWIFGRASPVSLSEEGHKLLKSSGCIVSDFGVSAASPDSGRILCSFEAVPIAFFNIPTLNHMVFSRALWENLLANQYLKRTMQDGAHFGEASHADRDEVLLKEVACRVRDFWLGDNNLVLGNVDILDTPNGRIIYSLAKVSRVGISSRGFGELRNRPDGLQEVVPDQYMHVCFDMVSFPAVPDASMTLITGDNALPDTEMMSMSASLRDLPREDRFFSSTGLVEGKAKTQLVNAVNKALTAQQVRYSPLFSNVGCDKVSKLVVSTPHNDAGAARDRDLENRIGVFKASLEARLKIKFKEPVIVDVVKEFLRDNLNVFFSVDVSIGGVSYKGAVRIVGSSYDLQYQFSVFGVKLDYAIGIHFLNDALVMRIVEEVAVKWNKDKE